MLSLAWRVLVCHSPLEVFLQRRVPEKIGDILMKFLDEAKIFVKSGDGGAGCVSFRREKFIEFGGPNGGDGGRGGHVMVRAVSGLNTLVDFRYRQHFKAQRGIHGMGSERTGSAGKDCFIQVPVGTQIFDETGTHMVADMQKEGVTLRLAKGGDGGYGNMRYRTSKNRAPRIAGSGHPGEEFRFWLRLKLFADIGIVGLPNAGKSTLLSSVSAARPKIADYPFTTLYPQLGVVTLNQRSFILADLPGLLEGASEGIGIGTRFLGHIERCGVLLHVIDGMQENVAQSYHTIRTELVAYGSGLDKKRELVALSKIDTLTLAEKKQKAQEVREASGKEPFQISAVTGAGIDNLLYRLCDAVDLERAEKETDLQVWSPVL